MLTLSKIMTHIFYKEERKGKHNKQRSIVDGMMEILFILSNMIDE
jgi:hypothetical protein